jgi:hypothetical protein
MGVVQRVALRWASPLVRRQFLAPMSTDRVDPLGSRWIPSRITTSPSAKINAAGNPGTNGDATVAVRFRSKLRTWVYRIAVSYILTDERGRSSSP